MVVSNEDQMQADIAARFRSERERLGFSANAFAHFVGRSGEGFRRFEAGETSMKFDALAAAARLGVDVQYVITGVRSENLDDVEAAIGYATLGAMIAAGTVSPASEAIPS
jgi:transcriptional regulator with XRE-family HTH domain